MKLVIGKPDDTELVLAEHAGGTWTPSATVSADLAAFLKGCDPEELEMWVEEPDED
jgi:hypothetical protein